VSNIKQKAWEGYNRKRQQDWMQPRARVQFLFDRYGWMQRMRAHLSSTPAAAGGQLDSQNYGLKQPKS
jgi:hypothetical protein